MPEEKIEQVAKRLSYYVLRARKSENCLIAKSWGNMAIGFDTALSDFAHSTDADRIRKRAEEIVNKDGS